MNTGALVTIIVGFTIIAVVASGKAGNLCSAIMGIDPATGKERNCPIPLPKGQ